MKRIVVLAVLVFLGVVSVVSAQTNEENEAAMRRFGFSWGLSFIIQPDVFQRTSSMGINFQVFDNGILHIRNHIIYNGGVLNMEAEVPVIKYTRHSISDKITVGTITQGLFHTYGFLEGGIGTCGLEKGKIFENQPYGSVELGVGLEVLALKHLSFFAEIGFFGNISELFQNNAPSYHDGFMLQQKFQLGVRTYF
jgi:hypothetical protein